MAETKKKKREFFGARKGADDRVDYYKLNGKKAKVVRSPEKKGMKWEVVVEGGLAEAGGYTVNMTKNVGGKPDTIMKPVPQAQTPEQAMQMAKTSIPNSNQYDDVSVAAGDGSTMDPNMDPTVMAKPQQGLPKPPVPVTRRPGVQPPQGQQPMMPESFNAKRFSYPYTMMLPLAYTALFSNAIKEAVKPSERYGRIYLKIETPSMMESFMKHLVKTKHRNMASVVMDGIIKSMRGA